MARITIAERFAYFLRKLDNRIIAHSPVRSSMYSEDDMEMAFRAGYAEGRAVCKEQLLAKLDR